MPANGYLPASELVTVQGDIRLERKTAAAFLTMRDDYAKETHRNMTIAAPAGGYRPWAMQLDMRAHPSRYNITPGVISGLPSDHGFGTEVDIGAGQDWAILNGGRYGFTRTKLAYHDPNHYHYDGVTVAALNVTPITEQESEHIMSQIQYYERTGTPTKEWTIAGREIGHKVFTDPDQAEEARINGRQYSGQGTVPIFLGRDDYIAMQKYWDAEHEVWKKEQIALIREALGTPTVGTGPTAAQIAAELVKLITPAAIAKAVNDDLHARTAE